MGRGVHVRSGIGTRWKGHGWRVLGATIVMLWLMAMPAQGWAAAQDDEPIRVVASFSVLADIVANVGGDRVEVSSLVPTGGDAHTFDPSPDQVATLADADLVVAVGGDFEPWLDDLVESSGTSAMRIDAFPEGDLHGDAADEDHEHDHDDAADEDHEHDHGDDEHGHDHLHAWLDVHNSVHAVERIAAALTDIDPDHASDYQANADAYTGELDALDAYIGEQTATVPEDQRLLVTTHNSFGAFADAYGYTVVGVLLESHSTEGADASASHVAELVNLIGEHHVPAVFPDTPAGAEMMQPVASEANVEIAPQLYVDTLGDEDSGAGTYIEMMRYNVDTIVAALGEQDSSPE